MNRVFCGPVVSAVALCGCNDDNEPNRPEGPPIWGAATDIPVPADYDGDGVADIAVYRPVGAAWYLRVNCDDSCDFEPIGVGLPEGVPVPGDYAGSGNARPAAFEAGAEAMWHLAAADCSDGDDCQEELVQWGQTGDIPVPADYDGDGTEEIAVVRPTEAVWYISYDNCSWETIGCDVGMFFSGGFDDRPAPADYDGDGQAEVAFLRPMTNEWHICSNGQCQNSLIIEVEGAADVLVPADYDGDGDDDIAFYTRSDQSWHIAEEGCTPSGCTMRVVQFGTSTADIPVPADYDGDGADEIAVASPGAAGLTWLVR